MGVSRRFLNLILGSRPGAKSLHRIDLKSHKLFNTRTPELLLPPKENCSGSELPMIQSPESGASLANDRKNCDQASAASVTRRKIPKIRLPPPIMNFRCSIDDCHWHLDCLPIAGRKVLCVDSAARTVVFDADTCQLETIPYLNLPKRSPLLCWVPLPSTSSADADATDTDDGGNGSFYILQGSPDPANQFEAFAYDSEFKSWQRRLLPPPPFACDPKHYEDYRRPRITSYAVVERGGSHGILVSADGGAGTYCLDTVTHTWSWSHVGDWVLPFQGKAEYVPELKLWFGICNCNDDGGLQLGAADLSTMDSQSQPQLVAGTWKEIEGPRGWTEMKPPQIVSLGSGRFCIARFFCALLNISVAFSTIPMTYDPAEAEYFTVLTGIEVVPCVHDTFSGGNGSNGKVELQMIKHNSRRHMSRGSDGDIAVVF